MKEFPEGVHKYAIITKTNVYMTESSTNDINIAELKINEEFLLVKIFIPFARYGSYSLQYGRDIKVITWSMAKPWDIQYYHPIINALQDLVYRWKSKYVIYKSTHKNIKMIDGETYYVVKSSNVTLKGNGIVYVIKSEDIFIDDSSHIEITKSGNLNITNAKYIDIDNSENIKIKKSENVNIIYSDKINIGDSEGKIINCSHIKINYKSNIDIDNSKIINYGGESKGNIKNSRNIDIASKSETTLNNCRYIKILGNDAKSEIHDCERVYINGKGKSTVDIYNVSDLHVGGPFNIVNVYDKCKVYASYQPIINVYGESYVRSRSANINVFTMDSYIEGYYRSKINVHRYAKINTFNPVIKHDVSKRVIKDIIPHKISDIIGLGGTINVYGYSTITGYDKTTVNTFCDCD